ncbi:MAG: quinone-dependent dihydroorotate dehydrogenase [Beijerinckiaceae bacterium]|nr:quinone-dependent dihydroorotate dehydrogenase [Beijerinckiaceae bacterium]
MFPGLFPLIQPLIRALDPETAHDWTVAALERMPLPVPRADDPRLQCTLAGLDLANPVGIAPGLDKHARVPDALMRLGFGFVEVGGVTLLPQPGNPKPRVFRLPADGAVINRYGLNSDGMKVIAGRLAARRRQGVLGVNLGANKESADRVADYLALVEGIGPLAEFVTLNVSSPNTPGLRDLQGRAFLDELLARVLDLRARLGLTTRIFLKIAPDLDEAQLDDIIAVARARGIDAMIVSNTTVARPDTLVEKTLAKETGGLSGKPLFRLSTIVLARTFLRVERQFPLIGVGGIASGEDAVAKIAAGADAIQLYSALIYQGPGLIGEIKSALLRAVERERVAGIRQLVGRNAATWAEA